MTNPKIDRVDPKPLTPLRAEDRDLTIAWRVVPAQAPVSCRWEPTDMRWVTVSLGDGSEMGQVIVEASDGRRALVSSYEDGLELARRWRSC